MEEIARHCGVTIARSKPRTGKKDMYELCADIMAVLGETVAPIVQTIIAETKSLPPQKFKQQSTQSDCQLTNGPCSPNPRTNYSRAELVAVAEKCGITQIYKKNMIELCQEIMANLGTSTVQPISLKQQPSYIPLPKPRPVYIPPMEKKSPLKQYNIPVAPPIELAPRPPPLIIPHESKIAPAKPRTKTSACVKQTQSKYLNRPSPPYPANECCGEVMEGNDGYMYYSKADKNGVCRWQLVN